VTGTAHRLRRCFAVTRLEGWFLRGARPAHRFTLSPQRGSLPNLAASFGLDTLSVRALSSSHLSDAWMLPSDFCHPIHLYPSAPVLSTLASAAPDLHPDCTRNHRFTPVDPLRRDRSSALQAVHLPVSWRPSPFWRLCRSPRAPTVISQSRACLHLNRRAHFAEPAVTRTRPREPRRLPPDSVRTPLLAEETRFTCAKVGPVSNIDALGGTPPRFAVGFSSPSQALTHPKVRERCSHSASPCPRPRDR